MERLLILDDDEQVARIVGIIAERCGFKARALTEQRRVFNAIVDWAPSLIVLDLTLPTVDGTHVLTELSSLRCGAKIILTSGTSSRVLDAARETAIIGGLNIVGVLAKPFAAAALRQMLIASGCGGTGDRTPINPSITDQSGCLARSKAH
jgi:DNA-binding response OmpR family regulator